MKLLIPKDKAIGILRQRLSELNSMNFNPKAWQDRVVLDLQEIFPLGSNQWLQVSQIQFDTFVTSEKFKVLNEGRETAFQLLTSYIDYIENYSVINEEREVIMEENFQIKYSKLLADWNNLVPEYNSLLKKLDSIQKEIITRDGNIENLQIENQRIKDNSVPMDKLTLGKLFKAIFNMPFPQLIFFFGILISLITGSFALGKIYQENASNNTQYELKTERDELKKELKSKKTEIQDLQNKLNKNDTIKIKK